MSPAQSITFWTAAVAYTVATLAVFRAVAFARRASLSTVFAAAVTGAVTHTAAVLVRWAESGHFPYVGNYEGVLFGTWLLALGYALLCLWRRSLVPIGVLVLPAVLVTMGYGVTRAAPTPGVPVVYQSVWLGIHFTFAWITYGVYLLAAGVAVGVLVRERAVRKGTGEPSWTAWLPDDVRLNDLSTRLVAFGFLNNAITLASGSIWAYRLWGSYWSWDPVETWTLLTWLAYGFYLHAKLTLGWDRRRLAWVAIVALFGVSMATWGVQLVPSSYHLFRDLGSSAPGTSRPR